MHKSTPLKSKPASKPFRRFKPRPKQKPTQSRQHPQLVQKRSIDLNIIDLLTFDPFTRDKMPKFTPQTIGDELRISPVKNTISLVTKECCSLCIPAYEGIEKAYFKFPMTFNYVEIDLEDPQNAEEYRGKYKYHIPVILVNGKLFHKGNFEGKYELLEAEVEKLSIEQKPKNDAYFIV